MDPDPKEKPEQKKHLSSTTKGPVDERRSTDRLDKLSALRLSKGRISTGGEASSEIPEKASPQSHGSAVSSPSNGRESVVRGLPRRFSAMSKSPRSERIGVKCERCQADTAAFRVVTDAIDIHVCPSCAEEARRLEIATEDLPNGDPKNDRA